MSETELYAAIMAKWGRDAQLDMVVEECAELIDRIQKYRRGRRNYDEIGEEMADVQNVINQFKPDFPTFERVRLEKLERVKGLLFANGDAKGCEDRLVRVYKKGGTFPHISI